MTDLYRNAYPREWLCPHCATFPPLTERVLVERYGEYRPYLCHTCYRRSRDETQSVAGRTRTQALSELVAMWERRHCERA